MVLENQLYQNLLWFLPANFGRILLQNEDIAGQSIKERADKIGIMQNPNQMISKAMIFDGLHRIKVSIPEDEIKKEYIH